MQSWLVFAVSMSYIGVLFAIAWRFDQPPAAREGRIGRWETSAVYSLSLAVYCTSWTFFGSVGRAASSGLDFLTIYIGPVLVFGLGWPLIAKMVRIAKRYNTVSIADFMALRYGKSQAVAALVTIVAVIGLVPYIALQLKAVSGSYGALTAPLGATSVALVEGAARAGDRTALFVAALMAVFAILFGVMNIQASEHHRGLMRAIAFESLVKLVAFLTVGIAVTLMLFGDPGPLLDRLTAQPQLGRLFVPSAGPVGWWSLTIVAALASLCLPRQFHVAVVEIVDEADVRAAAWRFPVYLVLINIFVVPVALAGLLQFGGDISNADAFVVLVPLHRGLSLLALIAFVGGLSAATGMVIVETVALSTMVCNDVVVPVLLRLRPDLGTMPQSRVDMLLRVRRIAVVLIIGLAYFYYRMVGRAYPLVSIGLISFAAVAQFGPTLLGGLLWRRGNRAGALAGISIGFVVWLWTLMLPSLADAGWIDWDRLRSGPFAFGLPIAELIPGLGGLDALSRSIIVSLTLNTFCYVLLSLLWPDRLIDLQQAELFVETQAPAYGLLPLGNDTVTLADLRGLAGAYLGPEPAAHAFNRFLAARSVRQGADSDSTSQRADLDDIRFTERLLAGAIGAASARIVVAGSIQRQRLSKTAAMAMLDEASDAIRFNHALLTATMENVPQGICVFDKELRLAAWNRRFVELNDLPTDLVQVGVAFGDIVRLSTARNGERDDGGGSSMLTQGALSGSGNTLYRRPDGTMLDVAITQMRNGGFVATITDVTERHQAAAALREANEGLERKVKDRTIALEAAKAEADSANLGKTRFLAAVGHDLAQPLHAARLFAAALADRYRDDLLAKLDAALRSVEVLLSAVLDVSKLDGGAIRAKSTRFRVDEILTVLEEEFTAIAAERGLCFTTVHSSLGVQSDPALLRRILQNFLSNAVRYTPQGRVLLGCRRQGGAVAIEVWDTGVGIADADIGEIFREFRQLPLPEDRMEKGLGLGLAIVERIAKILGHPVRVRSRPGLGSCFAVLVPVANAAAHVSRLGVGGRRRPGLGGALVAFVDNDPTVLDATHALLSGWNCRVVAATTAGEAMRHLTDEVPQAVIVDFHLELGRTGIEAAQEFRRRFGETLPIIVVTADHSPSTKHALDQLGYTLTYKPIRPAALRALLARAIAISRVA